MPILLDAFQSSPPAPQGSLGPILLLSWHPFFPDGPHVLTCIFPALIMLKAHEPPDISISFSVHNWKQHLKPTTCLMFINMSFEPSQGIFIVCNTDRAPIIMVQIKVVLNRNLFPLLNIMKGPLTFNLRSTALKEKKKKIRVHSKPWKIERRQEGEKKLGKAHPDLTLFFLFKIIRNRQPIIIPWD